MYYEYPDELTADMLEHYGVDIYGFDVDELDGHYGMRFIAMLAVQLPWPSRVHKAADPRAHWGIDGLILARIEYWLHSFIYAFSDDAKYELNAPQMIYPETDEQKEKRREVVIDGETFKRAEIDYETFRQIIEANVRGEQNG